MAKRGRKEVAYEDKRLHGVTCRLTESELELCDSRRGALRRGEWLRIGALKSLPPAIPPLNREAWLVLSKLAGNLATLAGAMREGGHVEIEDVRLALSEFRLNLISAKPIHN